MVRHAYQLNEFCLVQLFKMMLVICLSRYIYLLAENIKHFNLLSNTVCPNKNRN